MSLVFRSFIIQSALASAMDISDSEQKVLANNMTPQPSDVLSSPLAEAAPVTTTAGQSAIPTETADPMAAIMAADYARENAHLSQPGLTMREPEDVKTLSVPVSTESADPMAAIMAADYARDAAHLHQSGSITTEDANMPNAPASTESADPMAAVMAADYARENAHLPQPGLNIRRTENAKAPSAPASTDAADVADPMAAVMAADYASKEAHVDQPDLNIRKNEDVKTASTQSLTEDADPMAAIMAADYARENTHLPQPGLIIDKPEDEVTPNAAASTTDADPMAAIMAADYARENAHLSQADSEASFSFHVLGMSPKDMAHTPSTSQDGTLTKVKQSLLALIGWKKTSKPSSDKVSKETIGTFGQVTREAPLSAGEVEAKKAKDAVAMPDKPLGLSSRKYRNQGAALYHVEPTLHQNSTPEQDALWKEKAILEAVAKARAASLAARRKEVEDAFHISKVGQSSEAFYEVSTEAAPTGFLRTLTRFIFFVAGLCSIVGLTYHKYEVIVKMYGGKQGDHKFKLPNFKVKQDDDYGSAELPRFSPQVSTDSHMSSVVGSFRQGLSRRGAIDTTSSCGFGV